MEKFIDLEILRQKFEMVKKRVRHRERTLQEWKRMLQRVEEIISLLEDEPQKRNLSDYLEAEELLDRIRTTDMFFDI